MDNARFLGHVVFIRCDEHCFPIVGRVVRKRVLPKSGIGFFIDRIDGLEVEIAMPGPCAGVVLRDGVMAEHARAVAAHALERAKQRMRQMNQGRSVAVEGVRRFKRLFVIPDNELPPKPKALGSGSGMQRLKRLFVVSDDA